MENYILIAMIAISVVILVVSFLRHRYEAFVNFMLRILVGGVAIYFLNTIFEYKSIDCLVGMNGYSVLTLGALGTPGFLLMYAVSFYFSITA